MINKGYFGNKPTMWHEWWVDTHFLVFFTLWDSRDTNRLESRGRKKEIEEPQECTTRSKWDKQFAEFGSTKRARKTYMCLLELERESV